MLYNTPALLRRVISWPTRRTPIIFLPVLSRLVVQLSKISTISPSPLSVEISVSVLKCGLCIYVCVCVCVGEKKNESERKRERQRQRQTETEGGGGSSSTAIIRTMPECVCLFGESLINPINTCTHTHTQPKVSLASRASCSNVFKLSRACGSIRPPMKLRDFE